MENHFFLVGPWHKKWFVDKSLRSQKEVVAKNASSILSETSVYRMSNLRDRNQPVCCPVIEVSRSSFLDLVYGLPDFKMLQDFWNQWCDSSRPTIFVAECKDTKDIVAIDTQGFDYARYKAVCKKTDLNL